jgi:ABC-type transporter Mla subunit MlaD
VPRTAKGRPDARPLKRRDASRPPAGATRADEALGGLVARLSATCDALAHALQEAPKAADFQPLADRLDEFARAAPRLIESLHELRTAMDAMRASSAPVRPAPARPRLEQVMADLDTARTSIVEALETLPRDEAYGAVARQLRELATVSPSLMEWLQQVPLVSTPLVASAQGLQGAAVSLGSARDRLAEVVRELWPED